MQVENKPLRKGHYTGTISAETQQPHGFGSWKDENGTLRYEGEWNEGRWTGQGTSYDTDGAIIYKGGWEDGEQHGKGTLYFEDGVHVEYEGDYVLMQKHGEGTVYYETTYKRKYVGQWEDSLPHGNGTYYEEDGETIKEKGKFFQGTLVSEEEFAKLEAEAQEEMEEEEEEETPKVVQNPASSTSTTFSFTLTKDSPIMSAPIEGLFPRYDDVSDKMLSGLGFTELDDEDIPTPNNLQEGKTRDDWLQWVRKFYPKKGAHA